MLSNSCNDGFKTNFVSTLHFLRKDDMSKRDSENDFGPKKYLCYTITIDYKDFKNIKINYKTLQ